jgi:hypothetical protein
MALLLWHTSAHRFQRAVDKATAITKIASQVEVFQNRVTLSLNF